MSERSAESGRSEEYLDGRADGVLYGAGIVLAFALVTHVVAFYFVWKAGC